MNKVILFGGLVIIVSLILAAVFFLGDIGGFARLIGKKSQHAAGGEQMKFVGIWYEQAFGSISFSSDGTYRKGVFDGDWKIEEGKLFLYGMNGGAYWTTYQYSFSDNGETLTLRKVPDGEPVVLTKQ